MELLDYEREFLEYVKDHKRRVSKFGNVIGKNYDSHDNSKLDILFKPYALMKKKDKTLEDEQALDLATFVHVKNSPHHPEYWTSTNLEGFTRKNTNPHGPLECYEMIDEALLEMCADWCAMSETHDNTPFEWFNKVKLTRWLFSQCQEQLIYSTLKQMWENR